MKLDSSTVANTNVLLAAISENWGIVLTLVVLSSIVYLTSLLLKNTNLTQAIASKIESESTSREKRVNNLETNVAKITNSVEELKISVEELKEKSCSNTACSDRTTLRNS